MSLPGLLVSLLLAGIAIVIVAAPFLRSGRGRPAGAGPGQRLAALRLGYERTLTNILDLDEDLATGKINAQDHAGERERWLRRGIQQLRAMDELALATSETNEASDGELDAGIDGAIEAAVAAHRQGDHEPASQKASHRD